MDSQLAIHSIQVATLVNDDAVEFEALVQMHDDALNTDDELTDS